MQVHSNTPKVHHNLNSPKANQSSVGEELKAQEHKQAAVKEAAAPAKSEHLGQHFDFKA